MNTTRHVVLDTDIGTDVDDALCLLYAMRHPGVQLRAVTTVSGCADLRAQIAKKSLCMECRGEVPVYAGLDLPLMGERTPYRHSREGEGILEPGEAVGYEPGRAPQVIADLVMQQPGTIDLVAIGPLTNIAAALILEPGIVQAVRSVTLMCGHVWPTGATLDHAPTEHNAASDPEATKRVLRAGWPLLIMPLEITRQVLFGPRDRERLARSGHALDLAAVGMLDVWLALIGRDATPIHDPLALMALLDRNPFETRTTRLDVLTQAGDLNGMTVPCPTREDLPEVEVICGVDIERAHDAYMKVVAGS